MTGPALAVSLGCPAGVGPEVAVLAAARQRDARIVLVGDAATVARAAKLRRVAKRRLVAIDDAAQIATLAPTQIGLWTGATQLSRAVAHGKPTPAAGAAQLAWIDEATELVRGGHCDALVTAPVSKEAIVSGGGAKGFRGHTEHLASRLGAREVVMAFVGEVLTTALVTTHLPLSRVTRAITPAAVATSTFHLVKLLSRLRHDAPRVVVAALNPHAGEGGLLGSEERTAITPGVRRARRRLSRAGLRATVVGPMGAETAFRRAAAGDFDGVVAMYHDQATIPMKLLGFGDAVNVSLGLPITRTSVDHGTGYDVAGSGQASARGMAAALALAASLSDTKS